MFLAERLKKIPAYSFDKIEALERNLLDKGVDVISFGVGDPDLAPPCSVLENLVKGTEKNNSHRYPDYQGSNEYRQAITQWYKQKFNVSVNPNKEVISLGGSKEGITNILLACVNPGDYVLVPDPAYPIYKAGTILAGGIPYLMPLIPENGFLPDFSQISREVLKKTKLMFLNYPNNPTAAVANIEFFKEAVEFCTKNNIILCQDAAYSEITFDGYVAPSLLQVDNARDIAIEFNSFSKSFNMQGWRIGFAAGNAELIKALKLSKVNIDSGQFSAIQYAAAETLLHENMFIEKMRRVYRKRRDILIDGLNKMGWKLKKTQGTCYVWVPVPKNYTSVQFMEYLLNKTGIICGAGTAFGINGEGYARFSLTINEKRIEEAIERMEGLFFQSRKERRSDGSFVLAKI
jgi:LL-diaminopimelate aminotransferase